MYCPMCGNKMELCPPHDNVGPEVDWGEDDQEELKRQIKAQEEFKPILRDEYHCPVEKCFGVDYPLYHHQAWQGFDSRPGDNWSLTWLK